MRGADAAAICTRASACRFCCSSRCSAEGANIILSGGGCAPSCASLRGMTAVGPSEVSLCGGAAWSWAVETLRLQVLSSTEAEYCETASACKEVLAQERLFAAFRLSFPKQYPVLVDNHSAIALACGPAVHYQRTKHIATKFHFQRQLMLEKGSFGCSTKRHMCSLVIF